MATKIEKEKPNIVNLKHLGDNAIKYLSENAGEISQIENGGEISFPYSTKEKNVVYSFSFYGEYLKIQKNTTPIGCGTKINIEYISRNEFFITYKKVIDDYKESLIKNISDLQSIGDFIEFNKTNYVDIHFLISEASIILTEGDLGVLEHRLQD